jgi:hypothetical protein
MFSWPLKIQAERQILKQKITVQKIKIPLNLSTSVTASVGGHIFDIEGWTSPWAQVKFYSTQGNLNLASIADDKGKFVFVNALAPRKVGELCFLSIDTNQNASPPLCFSPPPPPSTKTTIRGLVLPPTLTLEKTLGKPGETISAWGKTVPNSSVRVFLFEEENPPLREWLEIIIPSVFAREGPALEIKSDGQGNFSFNLPSLKSNLWRLFVGAQIKQVGENPSPKSNILEFAAIPWWQWWLIKVLGEFLGVARKIVSVLIRPDGLIAFFSLLALWLTVLILKKRKSPGV